jgi:hypothetical protein
MKKLLTILPFLFSLSVFAQRFVERADPKNPQRKIVELKPVTHRLNLANAY